MRVLFGVCLAWIVYASGHLLLSLRLFGAELRRLSALDTAVLAFFVGAAVWHVVLLLVGLAGGYTRNTMVALTVLVVAAAAPHLRDVLCAALRRVRGVRTATRAQTARTLAGLLLLAAVVSAFVLVKGIYPAGGHDYYTHYFYYYLAVIKHGSLAPNEVWYHFFYSKGAGLYFLAILLTDPLAPQLVTTMLIGFGAATVFAILRQIAPATFIPWLGAVLYLALLVYTPGPVENMRHGGWGDLEKLHEPAAVLTLGIIWITGRALAADRAQRKLWILALVLSVAALVVVTTVMAALIGMFFALLLAWFACRRDWRSAVIPFLGGLSASAALAAILLINYLSTGIPLDQVLLYVWPVVDLGKVQSWGVLNEVIVLHWSLTGWLANKTALATSLPLLFQELRLDLWAPIALGAAVLIVLKAAGLLRSGGGIPAPLRAPTFVALLALAGTMCLAFIALGIGREQPISFYRFSSFMYAPTLCLFLGAWIYCPALLRPFAMMASAVAGCALVWWLSFVTVEEFLGLRQQLQQNLSNIFVNARHFAAGRFSVRDAYQNQQGWPGRLPWGGIYPAMEPVSRIVGAETPILSMHIHSYCMLPRCTVVTWMSMRVVRDSSALLYGAPEDARRVLRDEGLNYFVISKELDIRSPLPRAPLFAPDNIQRYLGVKWTDGTTYLLTWRDRTTSDIEDAFVARYREQTEQARIAVSFPYQELKDANEHFRVHGLQPYRVPWCTTCDRMRR